MPKVQKYFSLDLLLLTAIGIAILLRIIYLGSREFWYDEVLSLLLSTGQRNAYKTPQNLPVVLANYTALLNLPPEQGISDVVKTIGNLLKGLVKAEPHPPLFFLEQHIWLRIFGNSEIAMRSLAALFSIGAMGGAYGLGRHLLGHRAGLLFAALLGLNPYYLFQSLNARMYSSLVFWTIISVWSLLELISINNPIQSKNQKKLFNSKLLWILILIISVVAGFMTFYLFACWLIVLVSLVLFLDRQRWWQYSLYLGIGILVTTPWLYWGTRQQLRNADFDRFATSGSWIETNLQHLQDVMQALATFVVIGDWATSLSPTIITAIGLGAIALLFICSFYLWKQHQDRVYRVLGIVLLMSIFPLLLMLGMDVITSKFTIGFGEGRAIIFILPGCLLIIVTWIIRAAGKWQPLATIVVLLLYLSISVADFSLRPRWMFHQIVDIIRQESATPTLIVMNSKAWGHVLRLAYYLPVKSPVMLLTQKSDQLASTLHQTLTSQPKQYQQILWLDSADPVWGFPSTEAEKKQIQQVLNSQFSLEITQQLVGTFKVDNFTANFYKQISQ